MTTNVKNRDKTIDMKETIDLYGRLMDLARISRNVDKKEAIRNYEITLMPRAFFTTSKIWLPYRDSSSMSLKIWRLREEHKEFQCK